MGPWRLGLGIAGVALGVYGLGRLFTGVAWSSLVLVGLWLIMALLLHDGLLAPAVLGVGALLGRIPPRARRYLQFGLIMAALVTVVALPMIDQQRRQPPSKTLLQQDFEVNLMILLAIIAVGCLVGYAVRAVRDRAS